MLSWCKLKAHGRGRHFESAANMVQNAVFLNESDVKKIQ